MVNPPPGQPRQLGHPAADIVAIGIALLALAHRVEDAKEGRRIGAAAGRPLPAETVVGEVGINESVPEPSGAILPGEQEVLDQERRHYHADAIVHPAGGPEFAHAGVNEGIACLTALPRAKPRWVLPPREPGELGPQRLLRSMGKVEEQMVRKLTPAQLGQELPTTPHRRRDGPRLREALHRVPHLARADLAEMQVR